MRQTESAFDVQRRLEMLFGGVRYGVHCMALRTGPITMYTHCIHYIPPDQAASIDLTVSRHDSRVLHAN